MHMSIIFTKWFTFSIMPRWSFGIWRDEGMVTIDAGCLCCEVIWD